MNELWQSLAPQISPLIVLIQFVVAIAVALFATKFVPKEEHDALEIRVDGHALAHAETKLEIKHLAEQIKNLPSADQLHALSIQISELKGNISNFTKQCESVEKMTDRLQLQIDRMDDFLKKT